MSDTLSTGIVQQGHDVIEAQTFWDSVMSLSRDDQYRGQLLETMLELRRQPFRNPKLQTHDVGKARNGRPIFSSDVGGRRSDRRLVWQYVNETVVLLLYGTHAVQDRAKRMRIDLDEMQRVVTIYEQSTVTDAEQSYQDYRQRVGRAFMAWTDGELEGFGFTSAEVPVLRTLDEQEELLELEADMAPASFDRALNLLTWGHPDGEVASRAATAEQEQTPEAEPPEPTAQDRELERQLRDPRAGAWFSRTEPEYLQEILDQPIEDWMIFLHPDQRAVVERDYKGPARVRGAAGTGKTVVGLHRAARLARLNRERGERRPILFTTFIRSLPPVFEQLYLRIPGTRSGEVEFVHVDSLAWTICAQANDRPQIDRRAVGEALDVASRSVVRPGTPLGDAGFTSRYLRDEITSVIKGRGLVSLGAYEVIQRTGRRAPLGKAQRAQVWDLKERWDDEMASRGTIDFVDVVARARDYARLVAKPRYSAAIIDEVQDISLVGMQLVRALVNGAGNEDPPNGLLVLGDGAQRIYAGGFTLSQAGIEVRGRTTVLRNNYRNTAEIISTALTVTGESIVEDLAEKFPRGAEEAEAVRHGRKPLLVRADTLDRLLDALTGQIQELLGDRRVGLGDVGVLAPTNQLVQDVLGRLSRAGVPAMDLRDYTGSSTDRVKVGTYHRGKGLEFKAVILPHVSRGTFPASAQPGVPPDQVAEDRELAISQLFVAMTRARDALIVGVVDEASPVLEPHLDAFDVVEV